MATKIINKSSISGSGVIPPASKSVLQRVIAIATLAKGESIIHGYSSSNDSDAALGIARNLGANVVLQGTDIIIQGGLQPRDSHLHCGEAGLGIRMFTPIASLWDKPITLTGEGSLTKRPLTGMTEALQALGVQISTTNNFVPVTVCGPLVGGNIYIDGSLSSQLITGILIASPYAKNDTILNVSNLQSKPYIDITLAMMADFGVEVSRNGYETFSIKANQQYVAREYFVEGDWSGAAALLVAGALAGNVSVQNLSSKSCQADKAIVEVLKQVGAFVEEKVATISVHHRELRAFSFDATECPDLFPPLVALAAGCRGTSFIKGANRLTHKESNRAAVLQSEFSKLGIHIDVHDDVMTIQGEQIHGGVVDSHNDHRIAMATALAGLIATSPVIIEGAECVAKSYPRFWEDLEELRIKS